LQQMVYRLPADITLVRPGSLLNEPQVDTSRPDLTPQKIDAPRNPFRGVKMCKPKKPLQPVYATRFFSVIGESITQSSVVVWFQHQWQGWGKIAAPKNVSAKTD
ncbi:divergent polysaccharide deacetylase family protein, partial [Salmonella enterica]|nr:divergent polysaccharide deacetylase family protein [Salmonella enterica]